jgi:hypothetical protein
MMERFSLRHLYILNHQRTAQIYRSLLQARPLQLQHHIKEMEGHNQLVTRMKHILRSHR